MLNFLFEYFERLVDAYPNDSKLAKSPVSQAKQRLIPFIWECTQGMRFWILCVLLSSAFLGAFETYLFKKFSAIIDLLGKTTPSQLNAVQLQATLMEIATVMGVSLLVMVIYSGVRFQGLQANFAMRLRWVFHQRMLSQSMTFYQDEFAGRVATKVMQTALAVRDVVLSVSDILVFITIYFLSTSIVLMTFDWWLAVPFMVWLVGYLGVIFFFIPRLGRAAKEQADARSMMTGRVTDAYSNIATVKLFSHTSREMHYTQSAMGEFMVTAHRQMRLVSGFEIVNHALSMLLVAGTVGVALWRWNAGLVSVGALAAASAMAIRLNGMAHWIMWEINHLFEYIGTVQDGMQTLNRPNVIEDKPNAQDLKVTQGAIEFNNITFAYGVQPPIFDGFHLKIAPGEKIGLVGRSGAGKSTIVNLLLRFYDVQNGQILIDGQNIADVTQQSLRAHIGMVTQDTALLHRSVRDNIAYGKPDGSKEEVWLAAKKAQADTFISQLQDNKGRKGLGVHVGERGVKLSGGQRQRIAIARVMLKNAPILLLDEATSALDSEVELAIQSSLESMMENKTVIAIAHRLSTIAAMDRLVVLDEGKIVEQGTHQMLIVQNGLYARLWAHQSGGFLGND